MTNLAGWAWVMPGDTTRPQEGDRSHRTGVNCRTVEVDGATRRFIAYVPRQRPVDPRRVYASEFWAFFRQHRLPR